MFPLIKEAVAITVNIPEDTGLPEGSGDNPIVGVIKNVASWILVILGSIALISFVIAGIIYLTSLGDDKRMERAKRAMLYSIIGVVVGLSGFVLIQAINSWLAGGKNF